MVEDGWVSAPHIQFKNALFFIIKQGFSDQHHNRALLFFFHLTWRLCPLKVCLFEFYLDCMCVDVSALTNQTWYFRCSTFILGQKVEIRCDIVCPLNHPNNTTVNGESVLLCFLFFSLIFRSSFSSCNDKCFRCRSLLRSFYSMSPSGCTVRFHVHTRSIPNNST